ncbi:MAG: hypothetical protein WA733_04075 [Methylocystis sp.]
MTDDEFRHWVSSRKEAGRVIDIETCELGHWKAYDADPYGARPDLPEEMRQVGTNRFVRSPESRGWVCEDDLPAASFEAMYQRIHREARSRRASVNWFEEGFEAARQNLTRDNYPSEIGEKGREPDRARWLAGFSLARATIDEDDHASPPADWFEVGALAARCGCTRKMVPLILREKEHVEGLVAWLAGFDSVKGA